MSSPAVAALLVGLSLVVFLLWRIASMIHGVGVLLADVLRRLPSAGCEAGESDPS